LGGKYSSYVVGPEADVWVAPWLIVLKVRDAVVGHVSHPDKRPSWTVEVLWDSTPRRVK